MANQANRFQKQVNPDFIFLYPPPPYIVDSLSACTNPQFLEGERTASTWTVTANDGYTRNIIVWS